MTTPTDRPNLADEQRPSLNRLRELAPEIMSQQRDGVVALVSALTDVLALADKWDRMADQAGFGITTDWASSRINAAADIRRAITNHVTPDAPASETTETKG